MAKADRKLCNDGLGIEFEIEAPAAGTLSRIDQQVGAVVPMGGQIGAIKK